MDRIDVTGIEVYAHHGVLAHERETGQRFVVDVSVHLDLTAAGASDDLADTLDYAALARRVAEVAGGPPVALLESLAERVCAAVLEDPRVDAVEVSVGKPQAPLGVIAHGVGVTLHRSRS